MAGAAANVIYALLPQRSGRYASHTRRRRGRIPILLLWPWRRVILKDANQKIKETLRGPKWAP